MPGCIRQALSLLALLMCGLPAALGQPNWHDRPTIYVPEKPPTKEDLQRRESLKQYVLGLLYVREDRLLDAVKTFEKALELDPQATPIIKMLIPFYVALDRGPEALKATRKVLDQDPEDFETWYAYARQLKVAGQPKEARAALIRGLKVPAIKTRPEVAQPMNLLLGQLYENAEEWLNAAGAFAAAAKLFDHPEPLLDADAGLTKEIIAARSAELLERVGSLYLKAERYDDAVSAFQQAQKRYPDGAGRLNRWRNPLRSGSEDTRRAIASNSGSSVAGKVPPTCVPCQVANTWPSATMNARSSWSRSSAPASGGVTSANVTPIMVASSAKTSSGRSRIAMTRDHASTVGAGGRLASSATAVAAGSRFPLTSRGRTGSARAACTKM